MNSDKFNKYFNAFILIGMTAAMLITTAIKFQTTDQGRFQLIIAAVGSLMGVLSTVCSANGKLLAFLFGIIDVSIYGIMCYVGQKYGNAFLHALYFFPMQFVGIIQWRKRGASKEKKLQARRFDAKQWFLYSAIFLIGSVAVYLVLVQVDKQAADSFIRIAILADTISTVCNIIGQLLMSMAYVEQWYFWIAVNIFTIIMWTKTLIDGGADSSYAIVYIIKYSFYLLNCANGLRIWFRLSRKEDEICA